MPFTELLLSRRPLLEEPPVALKIRIHLAPWLHALLSSVVLTFVPPVWDAIQAVDPARLLVLATWAAALKIGVGALMLKGIGWLLNRFKVLDPPVTPTPAIAPPVPPPPAA